MFELNLQLFASAENGGYATYLNKAAIDPTSMSTTANIGAGYEDENDNPITGALSNLSAEMKEFYSQYLIKDVGPALLHAQFLDEEKLPKNHGRTIEWRKWEDFEKQTTPVVEGITPAPMKLSVNPLRAEISQYIGWVLLTDQVQLLTVDNTLVEYTEKLSQNAKLSLDTITREKIIAGCTNMVFAGGATDIDGVTATSYITPNDVAKMATLLRNNNAPTFADGSYVAIIHPSVAYDLMTNERWIDVVKYAATTQIFSGEIGKLYGVRFVQSTEAKLVKSETEGGRDYFICLFFGKGFGKRVALTSDNARIIVKPVGSSGSEDPGEQRGSVAWKVDGYTAAVTNPAYVFKYYCASGITGVRAND